MFTTEDYTIIAHLFPRLMGLIYFFAFFPFLFQIKGLIGSNGILPVSSFLDWVKLHHPKKCYYFVPSLFWFNCSNHALLGLVWTGTILSIALLFGFYPPLILLLLYILYLSLDAVGQDFLGFGWEGFLLETTFYAFFLSLTSVPNMAVWICINLLLFRFHFQAGAVKLQSHDPTWKNLTALAYHYQTQPIPNTTAWYIHKMPLWFHRGCTLFMFIAELIIPFGIFLTQNIRLFVFFILFGLQGSIWFTGNFSYLNHLTVVLSTLLLNNGILHYIYPWEIPLTPTPFYLELILTVVGSLFTVLQLLRLWTHFFPDRDFNRWLDWLSPFHLVARYGIFAVMTTKRYEIVVEGSYDQVEWKEYLFKYKPSEVTRRPRRISPYQPRVDWQIWFLPFTYFYRSLWFQSFLMHLLKGTPEVLKLIRYNPFPDKPPRYVRALSYDYTFSCAKDKRERGVWWNRVHLGNYSSILSLKDGD